MKETAIEKRALPPLKEKVQYALAFGVIALMLFIAGFPVFLLFFVGVLTFFIWKVFSSDRRNDTRRIFEFYLSANEILRDDDRRWYGFELQETIARGENILSSMSTAPPLVHFALGALYQKLGDHSSAVKYLSTIEKNIDEAKKYVTKDSEGMMGLVQMGMQNMGNKSNEMMNYEKENIELGTAAIDGDKATVPVKDKKSGETTDFTLKKESGVWKVAFDKSTLMEMAQKKMKEHGMGNMNNGMNDSLESINNRSMQSMDSVSHEDMKEAQKMLDSANKMLNDAKK